MTWGAIIGVFLIASASAAPAAPAGLAEREPAAPQPVDRHPIPIRHPPPETPIEAAGSGLAPEVAVEVRVDARGRIGEVRVGEVIPASEHDAAFREAAERTLREWRYAPKLAGGQPAEATLSWTLKFPERDEEADWAQPGLAFSGTRRRGRRSASDADDLHRKLLAMRLELRARYLAEAAERAAGFMDQAALRKVSTPRFLVYSDHPDEGVAELAARNLEATFNIIGKLLGPALAPQVEPYRVVALMYAGQPAFARLRNSMLGREWADGFASPVGLLAFHMQMPSNESLVSVLLHEATHAYLDRYAARPGVLFPRWFHEGLAQYVGNSKIDKDGVLIPGRTPAGETYRGPWGPPRYSVSNPRRVLDELKRAIKRGEGPAVGDVLAATSETFYGDPRPYYAKAWLFVHFLRHGEPSWAEERFPALTLYLAEGFPSEAALREVYGDPQELGQHFRQYVREF